MMTSTLPSAYLAGPDVFFPDAKAIGKAKCELLLSHGIIGHFPLDNEVPESPDIAHEIFLGNVQLINRSTIVLANIVPFRGPSLDPGTAWEIGYAYAKSIPVICYGSSLTYLERCRFLGLEGAITGYDKNGMLIEDFSEQENLMISRCAAHVVASFQEAVGEAQRLLS